SRRQRAIGVLYASAGSKKAHMTKNAGFYIVSLVGKVLINNIIHIQSKAIIQIFSNTHPVKILYGWIRSILLDSVSMILMLTLKRKK
ncbi:MAG: hypothetical protein PUD65_06650, partial [Spirochaetales bacterium]|nr:hypothetical protein [Spirochaetales bacterium]